MASVEKLQDFYGINGFFMGSGRWNPFGGFFYVDSDCESASKKLEGTVADVYGAASIFGGLSKDVFSFRKQYRGRGEVVAYQFERSNGGVWKGKYCIGGDVFSGDACCKIALDWRNQKTVVVRKELSEEFWDAEGMVDEDYVKKAKEDLLVEWNGKEVL